jgi:hypothetical protein
MQRYDCLKAPDPKAWLALDEQERIELVRDYHRRARIRLPNATVHAVLHTIVETQIAQGDETPARTTQRLTALTGMKPSMPLRWCSQNLCMT